MTIPCSKAEDISMLVTKVKDLDKTMNGNGQKGIKEIVIRLDENVTNLRGDVSQVVVLLKDYDSKRSEEWDSINKRIEYVESAIQVKSAEEKTAEKVVTNLEVKKRLRINNIKWLITTIVALSAIICGLVVDRVKTHKKLQETTINENGTGENLSSRSIYDWEVIYR